MIVKVLRQFRDKYTKEIYRKGQKIEVSNDRYEEINSTNHGTLVEQLDKPKAQKKPTKSKK
jgi:hypothetical protein